MNDIKIFRVDDCDWYAAKTQDEAIKKAMHDSGESRQYYEEEGGSELSEESMLKLKYVEDDGTEKTFRKKLDELIAEGCHFPCMFASTEY